MRKSLAFLIWMIFLMNVGQLGAQYSTAEFLARVLPPIVTGEAKVPDGNRTLELFYPYLFVGNQWYGIQIINVENPLQPKLLSEIKIDGTARNAVKIDQYMYIADASGALYIYDISSPEQPVFVKRIRLRFDVQWVTSDSSFLYLALGSDGIGIMDISDPTSPGEIAVFKTGNFAWETTIANHYLFVSDNRGGMIIYDISSPANPVKVSDFDTPNMVRSVIVDGPYAYVADGPGGLWVIDISDVRTPIKKAHLDIQGFTYGVHKSGQYVYLADEKKGLLIINASNPEKPFVESNVVPESPAYDVIKYGIYLFLCTDKATLFYRHDNPPVLTDVQDQAVDENQMLSIQLQGVDPDNDPIYYAAQNLPEGASLDSVSGYFEWTPTFDQAGIYKDVIFKVVENTSTRLSDVDTITITVNNVNRSPSLPEIAAVTIKENQPFELVVPEGSDPDKEDKGKLVYLAENLPEGGTFDPAQRKFSWTPTYEQSGTYLIDFLVKDLGDLVARQTFTLTVEHVDRPPIIEKMEPVTGKENELITFQIKGMDPDKEDINRIRFELGPLPEGATFDPSSQTFSWTPTYEQSGMYTMVARIISGGYADSTSIKITVLHVNRPPVLASIEPKTVDENKKLEFAISGSDPDKEDVGKLTFSAANLPEGATFDPNTATFSWTPTYEQSGNYTVTFTISDPAGLQDSRDVPITVNHVNRPPVLADIPSKTIDENQLLAFTLQGSDPDREDTGKLQYSGESLPEGATLDEKSGAFAWTPTYEQSGKYTITFAVTDGQYQDTQVVHITVNHVNRPPVLADIPPQTVDENTLLTFTIQGSDPDKEDTGKLTFYASNLPQGAQFDPNTRTFSWTPTYEQSGTYQVTFGVSDPSGLKDEKTIVITVNHVNRPPVLTAIEPITIDENQPIEFALQGSDPDREDQGKLSYFGENLPEGASLDAESGLFSWTPTYDQSGVYTFVLGVTDQQLKTTQEVKITVNHVNRPPVMEAIAVQTVKENEILNVVVSVQDPDKEDQGKLTVTAADLPKGAVFDPATTTFSWKPTFDQAGNYKVTFTVKDPAGLSDSKSVTITVENVNRAPSIEVPAVVNGRENEPVSFVISGSDPDQEDLGKLVFSAMNLPEGAVFDPATFTFQWVPTFDQAGEYQVQFRVVDTGQLSAEGETKIVVENVNRPPVLNEIPAATIKENELFTYTLVASDPDKEDADKLVFSLKGDVPSGLKLVNGNQLQWTPDYEQSGSYQFTVNVTDGELTDQKDVQITVQHVNRPPVLDPVADQTVKEHELLKIQLSGSDPDKEDEGKVRIAVSGLPEGATFDETTHTIRWTPGYDQAGTYTVQATISDGALSDSKSFRIVVENVNRAPELQPIANVTVKENEKISVPLQFSDPDQEDQGKLKISIEPQLPGMKFNAGTKTIEWKPDYDRQGTHKIKVTVSDGTLSVSQTFNIVVENVNRPPAIDGPSSVNGQEGEKIRFSMSGSDPDKNDKIVFTASNLPDGASFDGKSGTFEWTPAEGQAGDYTVEIKVMDSFQAEMSKKVSIHVKPKPKAPADSTKTQ
jgi:PKD repeat protein